MQDLLVKSTVEGARVYAVDTTHLVRETAGKHGCSHLASAILGRAMTGALLLAATMKENERISIYIEGDGPAGRVVADAEGPFVRGYLENPNVFLPLKDGKLDVGGAVGKGVIMVTRHQKNSEPFSGYCELEDGEIASDITKYLYTSEQTPASVALGVLVDKDGTVTASGGYFIQGLPGCPEETLAKLEENVKMTPYVTQLMEIGYGPERIVQAIGRGLNVKINAAIPVSFKCRCSREKITAAFKGISRDDLAEMAQDENIEARCDFCNTTYYFTRDEILKILENK